MIGSFRSLLPFFRSKDLALLADLNFKQFSLDLVNGRQRREFVAAVGVVRTPNVLLRLFARACYAAPLGRKDTHAVGAFRSLCGVLCIL